MGFVEGEFSLGTFPASTRAGGVWGELGARVSPGFHFTAVCPSIRSLSLERSGATTIVEGAIEDIALNDAIDAGSIDPASKRQHVPGLRSNHEVLFIDRALHTAGLIRSFKMTRDHRPLLLKFQVLRGGGSVRILAVQGPFAGNIRRQLLCGRLLR
jgi:hypothetical protein